MQNLIRNLLLVSNTVNYYITACIITMSYTIELSACFSVKY